MSTDWEATFRTWSRPSSDTEQDKCDNAVRMVRDAIRSSALLAGEAIDVFAQGSYRNNTNVRQESDVDICVCSRDVLFSDFSMADGFGRDDVGLLDGRYTYAQFKDWVEQALTAKFGAAAVTRGNKAFDVHESTYRTDADVVAAIEHRRYTTRDARGDYCYLIGTQFLPDRGGVVINWPDQHYANGVSKNQATGSRFKHITRALKRLRNEMADREDAAAKAVPSYLIECLVWNVPNEGFGHPSYRSDMRYVLAHTCNETRSDETCSEWGEVNELKYLFRASQPWTREQANSFLNSAWHYIGFE